MVQSAKHDETISLSVRLPRFRWMQLKKVANKHKLSMDWVANKVIAEWLDAPKQLIALDEET